MRIVKLARWVYRGFFVKPEPPKYPAVFDYWNDRGLMELPTCDDTFPEEWLHVPGR